MNQSPSTTETTAGEASTDGVRILSQRVQRDQSTLSASRWLPILLTLPVVLLAIALRHFVPTGSLFFDGLELKTLDARFLLRGPQPPAEIKRIASQVAIVAIDDAATQKYGRVLSRATHAQLVHRLKAAGAKAVIFDVLFIDPSHRGARDDARFAEACRLAGNVFLPFDDNSIEVTPPPTLRRVQSKLGYEVAGQSTSEALGTTVRLRPPLPTFFEASRGGGHVATKADSDGKFRASILLLRAGAYYPHAALDAVARSAWNIDLKQPGAIVLRDDYLQIGKHRFGPLEMRKLSRSRRDFKTKRVQREAAGVAWMMPLNFLGGHETMQELTIPYLEVLSGGADDLVRGRVVIVGETATGTPDIRPGPFDRQELFLGVETNATFIANLLNNDFLRHAPRWWSLLSMTVAGMLAGLSVAMLRPWLAFALSGTALLVFAFAATMLFMGQNLVVEMSGVVWAMSACFASMTGYRLAFVDRAAHDYELALQESQALLGQFVDSGLARELSSNSQARLALQIGARREVTVLFSDIRGFTAWSDLQPPEEVVTRLGEYFPVMCEIASDDHEGFIDKFIGDALMVVWNALKDQPDHATLAVRAALSMQRALDLMNEGWQKQGQAPFRIGIGVATGNVVFGTFGSPRHKLQPTVLGDTVNFAARLEAATKEFGGRIIIAQSTFEQVRDHFEVRELGATAIRGKSEVQTIYEVLGPKTPQH